MVRSRFGPALKVLIKTTRPDGPDPDETEPFHQGLAPIEVERDILDSGVTKDYLDDNNGVPITIAPYEHMRKNSIIIVLWGVEEIRLPLITAAQVGKPVKFTIPKNLLTNLPPANPLLLTYRFQDVVNNHSAANARPIFINFNPALVLLEAPVIDKADGEEQLDLDALLGEDVETLIFSSKVSFVPGDVVDLSWRGVSAGGRQVPVDMQWKPEASTRSHTFMIPYYPVHLIARGFAKVDYRLTQAANPATLRYSRTTYAKMIGMPLRLAAPEVPEAKGGGCRGRHRPGPRDREKPARRHSPQRCRFHLLVRHNGGRHRGFLRGVQHRWRGHGGQGHRVHRTQGLY